jgi:hypothetical protein
MSESKPSRGLNPRSSPRWLHGFDPSTRPSAIRGLPGMPRFASRSSDGPPATDGVYTFDARSLYALDMTQESDRRRFHDELSLLTSLQGIVNRQAVRLFLFINALDPTFRTVAHMFMNKMPYRVAQGGGAGARACLSD